MPVKNPFTASFGTSPPVLVGRDDVLEDIGDGLAEGPGALERAVLLTGVRGVGKTVMLNAIEDQARSLGWVTISTTALPGFLDRLVDEELPRLLHEHHSRPLERRVTGVSIAKLAGFNSETIDRFPRIPGLASMLTELLDLLEARGVGLLITVDEVHRNVADEITRLGALVQHMFREERELAIAMSGLPAAVSDLLSDRYPATFIRRASRFTLGAVNHADVERALREPVEAAGRTWAPEALERAATATGGYPFLIQLIGTHVWRKAGTSTVLDVAAASAGVARARRQLGQLVHEPALRDLSPTDRTVLVAMAIDDDVSSVRDLAERLGVEPGYISVYRARLSDAGMVSAAGHGRVRLEMPYLRDYLREHAASLAGESLRGELGR